MSALLLLTLIFVNPDDTFIHKQQQLISTLYYTADYYQCIAESRRYSMLTDDNMDYTIALCYCKGNQLATAVAILQKKEKKECCDYLLLSKVYTSMQHYHDALHALSLCDISAQDKSLQLLYYQNILAVYINHYDWDNALNVYTEHSDRLQQMHQVYTILNAAQKEKINPYIAATLSAIIPGSGHCYARHRADGLISFITIAVLSAATYFAYSQGSIALTCTLGTLTAIGYAGNVYSAYNSAIHTQETMNNNYRTELNRYLEYNPEQFLPQWMKK